MSSCFQRVGRHMRGDWLKTWIASQPRSTPRSCACTRPPAVDTWAPISIACRMRVTVRAVSNGRAAHRRRADGTVQLAARARLGRRVRAAHRGHRPRALDPENVELILDALRWLELDWDEGPVSQAERAPATRRLSSSCSNPATPTRTRAPSACACPTRARSPSTTWCCGDIANPYSAIKDFVIQRSDGSPLYNLAVAVDDRDMGITHVVRGAGPPVEHPRQLMILRALGARAAGVRAPAAAPRPRRQEALEAPRRGVGPGGARRTAICPRRCATTSRCSAGATTRRRRS